MVESYVQVAPNSTGEKIRNVSLDVLQPDGTVATVLMQVVVPVDRDGFAMDSSANLAMLTSIRNELRALRLLYAAATNQFTPTEF